MYCDASGRPDPNGDYEIINGKKVLRDGRYARFDLAFRDSAPDRSVFLHDAPTQITDAQIATFRDSAAGQEAIAYAKSVHAINGWRSGPWSDQMERQAIADALTPDARPSAITDAAMADAKAQEEAAYQRSISNLNRRNR